MKYQDDTLRQFSLDVALENSRFTQKVIVRIFLTPVSAISTLLFFVLSLPAALERKIMQSALSICVFTGSFEPSDLWPRPFARVGIITAHLGLKVKGQNTVSATLSEGGSSYGGVSKSLLMVGIMSPTRSHYF